MNTREALEHVIDVASAWGENAEEAFSRRIEASDTDEAIRAMCLRGDCDIEDALRIRDLWQALALLQRVLAQRGCEHFDRAAADLTTLCDIVMEG